MTSWEYLDADPILHQDIGPQISDGITEGDLFRLSKETKGRLAYEVVQGVAWCRWVDYYKTDSGRLRQDQKTGAYDCLEVQEKVIRLL